MNYSSKSKDFFSKKWNGERRRGFFGQVVQVEKRRSLHSPEGGAELTGDRTRHPGDVTHDYSNVYGWNLKGKQRGC